MACLPEAYLQKIPDALTAKDCMALGTAGYTAMLCVLALLDSGVNQKMESCHYWSYRRSR